jgi:DNA-binding LacI/PurR family transcriptional regulator
MINKKTEPTAKDIAKIAGVSQSTVSRVLNKTGTDLISKETIKRVQEIATEMGYSPNPFARALRGKGTRLIGLVVREMADPFFSSLISEISVQANRLGYRVVLAPAHSDPDEALKVVTALNTQHTDGVIILGDLRSDEKAIHKILEEHSAVVTMCRGSTLTEVLTINIDNSKGMRLLLDHLINLGHLKFAFLDGGWLGDIHERRFAFMEYLHNMRLMINPDWLKVTTNDAEGGYQAMKSLLMVSPRPTAVLASDDVMAIGAMKAVYDSGLTVPKDISITGFDDIDISSYIYPALTTIQQPIQSISEKALYLLLDAIKGKEPQRYLIQVDPKLIVRQSTGCPPRE